jgi:NADPH:quinone reductase-like Zn-dependent oxidoreductase
MVNAQIRADENVLITGIGGGVALLTAQLCIAKGANVYVTSGNDEKILRAVALGAKGGVNYKSSKFAHVGYDCELFFMDHPRGMVKRTC